MFIQAFVRVTGIARKRGRAPLARRLKSRTAATAFIRSNGTTEALAGLERWKARYPEAAVLLQVEDVLVDSMRGRSTTWTRIRINLRNVPEGERPPEDPPEPDYDPWPAAPRG